MRKWSSRHILLGAPMMIKTGESLAPGCGSRIVMRCSASRNLRRSGLRIFVDAQRTRNAARTQRLALSRMQSDMKRPGRAIVLSGYLLEIYEALMRVHILSKVGIFNLIDQLISSRGAMV